MSAFLRKDTVDHFVFPEYEVEDHTHFLATLSGLFRNKSSTCVLSRRRRPFLGPCPINIVVRHILMADETGLARGS